MDLDKIKLKLGIVSDEQDDLLMAILDDAINYMTVYMGIDTIPEKLKFIAEEVTIKRYRRLGSEGISNEKIDVLSTTYNTDDFSDYRNIMDVYINKTTNKGYRLF